MSTLIWLLVFACSYELTAEGVGVILTPDRSLFTNYDEKIACISTENDENKNQYITVKLFGLENGPFNVSGNTIIIFKRIKAVVDVTIACFYNGEEQLRRTIVYIPKPNFEIKIIPDAKFYTVDSLGDIECTVDPWAEEFKSFMRVLGEEPVHREVGGVAKLTRSRVGTYYFTCNAIGYGNEMRRDFQIKVFDNVKVPSPAILEPLIYYLSDNNASTNLTFKESTEHCEQLGCHFISGDDIMQIVGCSLKLKRYARPGQIGTYQITNNRQNVFTHKFSYVRTSYQTIFPEMSEIKDFKSNTWKCGFDHLPTSVSDLSITIEPKHNPFTIDGNTITRIHGFGGVFVVHCNLQNGDFVNKLDYTINVLAIAALNIKPKIDYSYKGSEPEFKCLVEPPNEIFNIKWIPKGSSKSHKVSSKNSNVLVPSPDSPYGKASYECVADALTVHLSSMLFFEVRETPPVNYNRRDIVVRPTTEHVFLDDVLPSHSCHFNHTDKFTEAFTWKRKDDTADFMLISGNKLFVGPTAKLHSTGYLLCMYLGIFILEKKVTVIGYAEMELRPPDTIIYRMQHSEFKCFLKGHEYNTNLISWTIPENNGRFVTIGNELYIAKFDLSEWAITCNFNHGVRQLKKMFLFKIRVHVYLRIYPPISARPRYYLEVITCFAIPTGFRGVWHCMSSCCPVWRFWQGYLTFAPIREPPCRAIYKCEWSYGHHIKIEVLHAIDNMPSPPERLLWTDATLNYHENFIFTWDTRPVCCNLSKADEEYNYALWWVAINRNNWRSKSDLIIKGNCMYVLKPSHGDWGEWACIFNGHVAFKRHYLFLTSNETEIYPSGPVSSKEHFRRECRFKNTSNWFSKVKLRPVWESSSYISEGLELIYFNYTKIKKLMVYCHFEYRGEHFQSKSFDISSTMAWEPGLEVSQGDWSAHEDTHKIFFRKDLKPITCKVRAPIHDSSTYFLATWSIPSNNSLFKIDETNPQNLIPFEVGIETEMPFTCFVKLLGQEFSLTLHITTIDALFLLSTGPEVVIGSTPLTVHCLTLPNMAQLDWFHFSIKKNGIETPSSGRFSNPHDFYLKNGAYTIGCEILESKSLTLPRIVHVKEIPDLVLSNPTVVDFIVDGAQVAECIMQWKTPGGKQVGKVVWCNIKENDGIYTQKNKLFFEMPQNGFVTKTVECCFAYMEARTQKKFTFNVYDPSVIEIGSLPNPSKQILSLEDPCDDICQSNWDKINKNEGFKVKIVNPILVNRRKSSLEIVVKNNTYSCKNVDQPVCFETTCLATLNSYHFRPVTRQRCYSHSLSNLNFGSYMLPEYTTMHTGGAYICVLKDMTLHIDYWSWRVKLGDEEEKPLSAGLLKAAIPPEYAGQTIVVMCAPHHVNGAIFLVKRSILVEATANISMTRTHENCILPGEILTCVASSGGTNLKMILKHFDKDTFYKEQGDDWVRVPQNVYMVNYRFGCQINEEKYVKTKWFSFSICVTMPRLLISHESVRMGTPFGCRVTDYNVSNYRLEMIGEDEDNTFIKYCPFSNDQGYSMFDVICPAGNVLVRCSAYVTHNNSEKLIASTIFMMELIAYEPFFGEDRLSHSKIGSSVLMFVFLVWLSVLTCNICVIIYLHHLQNIKRCVLLELMHDLNLGGARTNIKCETEPFLYLMRREMVTTNYLHLRNCIQDYERFLDLGQSVFFLWLSESGEARLELLKAIRQLLGVGNKGPQYWSLSLTQSADLFQDARNVRQFSKRDTRIIVRPNFGGYIAKT